MNQITSKLTQAASIYRGTDLLGKLGYLFAVVAPIVVVLVTSYMFVLMRYAEGR